jgi:hypothetical protein
MATARIKHEGKTYEIDLNGKYSKEDRRILESLGIIETEKPKKKYKNVKQEKEDQPEDDE